MANEEHLKILRERVEGWNRWREENRGLRPDLTNANLRRTNLSEANLSEANLSGAHLSEANLSGAHLSEADLFQAYLTNANLRRTNLSGAHLSEAKLDGADLRGANLTRADLHDASLRVLRVSFKNLPFSESYLKHALVGSTVFGTIDLNHVHGLESVDHDGPSEISVSTLQRSKGKIPEAFLRGCGLSNWEIEAARLYDPNLMDDERTTILYEIHRLQTEQPIMQHRLFISYSHADSPFVEVFEPLLDEKGIRYWRDVHDMKAGRMEKQIDRAITLNPLVLLILSENSVKSDWVELEAATARELERKYRDQGSPRDVLCPVALDDAWKRSDWPGGLRRQIEDYNILDFSGWEEEGVLGESFRKLYEGDHSELRSGGGLLIGWRFGIGKYAAVPNRDKCPAACRANPRH